MKLDLGFTVSNGGQADWVHKYSHGSYMYYCGCPMNSCGCSTDYSYGFHKCSDGLPVYSYGVSISWTSKRNDGYPGNLFISKAIYGYSWKSTDSHIIPWKYIYRLLAPGVVPTYGDETEDHACGTPRAL